jgi:hypothetical protein
MTKKARTGKLYSEVEGEMLMEEVPDDTKKTENNTNEEKMTEIEDIRASHDVDAIMTDDKDDEIVFEQEHTANTSTNADSNTSSSLSSSDSSTSGSDSDSSSEVVFTKVVQGKAYKKPDDWPSDDENEMNNKLSATALRVSKDDYAEDNLDPDGGSFTKVLSKNNTKKQTKKQTKIDNNKNKEERMDRAQKLLQATGRESDDDEIECDKDSEYKMRATKKSPSKMAKHNKNKAKREAEQDLPRTINEYRIDMDKGELRKLILEPKNILFAKYTKDKLKPKPYHKADRWDRPLAKAPGGRSFEADVNKFLQLISKETKKEITRSEMEGKVLEVGRQAGMLASTLEGIWARKFIVDTCVSHPMDLLAESWQDDGRMFEHSTTRLFWVISYLMGNQWTRRNPIYLPPE